jgi:phage terminase large subunit-like protein
VARKNGKSEEAAVVCAYMLLADGEFGAEIYTAATKHDQAKIVFDAAKVMIQKLSQDSAKVRELVKIHGLNVSVLSQNARLEPLSSRSEKQDGLNPSCGIIDEYHAHPDSDLMEVIETGMGSRTQPLIFVITTAGFNKQSPCHAIERRLASDILKGIQVDDSMFTVIYTLDEGDDWKDKEVWKKANPNIGITPTWEFMEQQCNLAILKGKTKEVEFKTKNLNIWTDSSMAWISDEIWMKGAGDLPELKGRTCYGGLDMASVRDFNAFVYFFPPEKEGDKFCVLPIFWLPEQTIDQTKDVANYWDWKADGFIRIAGDVSTDKDIIKQDILEISRDFKLKGFAYDRWFAQQSGLIKELLDEGIEGFEFGQGYKSMSPAIKDLETLILQERILHGGNPVLRWMCQNVELEMDAAENVKMNKAKSSNKIDGMVALVMAMACFYAFGDTSESIYEKRGIRTL